MEQISPVMFNHSLSIQNNGHPSIEESMSNNDLLNGEQAEVERANTERADAEQVVIYRAESPPVGASNDHVIYLDNPDIGHWWDQNGNLVGRDGNPIINVPEPDNIPQNDIVQNDTMQNDDFRQDFIAGQEDYGSNPQYGHGDANGYDL